jgi:hypothetical protein
MIEDGVITDVKEKLCINSNMRFIYGLFEIYANDITDDIVRSGYCYITAVGYSN